MVPSLGDLGGWTPWGHGVWCWWSELRIDCISRGKAFSAVEKKCIFSVWPHASCISGGRTGQAWPKSPELAWLSFSLNMQEFCVLLIFVPEAWTPASSVTPFNEASWISGLIYPSPCIPQPHGLSMWKVILAFSPFLSVGVEEWKVFSNISKSIIMFIQHHHHLLP